MGETIEIDALGEEGRFSVHCAHPAGAAKAAIIVIQEIFGVNAGIRKKADDWAAAGYLALAPDMFWRFAPGFDADPDVEAQSAKAFEIRAQFDADKAIFDVEAVIRVARKMIDGGKVGLVGFCMGGRIAYLSACRTDIDASVGYYGARIDQSLGESHGIAKPLLLHFAERDHFIPPEALAAIKFSLEGNSHVTMTTYPNVDHGFADTFGKRRADAEAQQADALTRDFFAQHLA